MRCGAPLDYAGDDGFVASLPQLLHARAQAPYDNIIWNTWFSANTEETVCKTPAGHHVMVTVHGGGLFASPERFETGVPGRRQSVEYRGLHGRVRRQDLAAGRPAMYSTVGCPTRDEIPVYAFREFERGIPDQPRRYAVVMDFETARNSTSGYVPFDDLKEAPLMIVRAGGTEAAAAYLDKARDRHTTPRSWATGIRTNGSIPTFPKPACCS